MNPTTVLYTGVTCIANGEILGVSCHLVTVFKQITRYSTRTRTKEGVRSSREDIPSSGMKKFLLYFPSNTWAMLEIQPHCHNSFEINQKYT